MGVHLKPFKDLPLYLAAGPYYLTNARSTWGAKARIAIDCCDYIRLEGSTSYDHLFKWIGQGQISFTLAFGRKREIQPTRNHSCATMLAISDRAIQKVDRNEIIPVHHKHFQSLAIDPATDLPFFFWFVDSMSHSSGTFESPFPGLELARDYSYPGDFIYVFATDNSYDAADFFLQNYQHLWGSGTAQQLQTNWGFITIPALTADLPRITTTADPAQPIIQLSPYGCEASGIHVLNTNNNAIGISSYQSRSIHSANIHHNLIDMGTVDAASNYFASGIYATAAFSISGISEYHIYQNTINLALIAGDGYGIWAAPSNATDNSNYNIFQNTINLTLIGSYEIGTGIQIINSPTINNAQYNISQNMVTIQGNNSSDICGILIFSRYAELDNSNYRFAQNRIHLNLQDGNGCGIYARSTGSNNQPSTNNSQYSFSQNRITMTQIGSGSANMGIRARYEGGNYGLQVNHSQYSFDQNQIRMNVTDTPSYGVYVDSISGLSTNISIDPQYSFNQNELVLSGTEIEDGIYVSATPESSGVIHVNLTNNVTNPYQILLDTNGGLFSFDVINNYGNQPPPIINY